MGEFGIDHNTFMHDLRWWQIIAIINGRRRGEESRISWARLNTWISLLPNVSKDSELRESPSHLYRLPHDEKTGTDQPTEDEIEQMRREMQEWNERHCNG